MKIIFLTSCLEPGKDGVGDYTRLLAESCQQLGHSCFLIALNDRHVLSKKNETQSGFETLRLGQDISWDERFAIASSFTSSVAPDWFSLQFVSYGFHPRGMNMSLAKRLKKLVGTKPLQIMFHEIWIGAELTAGLKNKLVGAIQKYLVLDLIRALSPRVVQTSNPAYVHLLRQEKIVATQLPLFGNIPTQSESGDNWILPKLTKNGVSISEKNRSDFWLFGFFGTLHPVWPPEPLFSYLRTAALRENKKIVLLGIGRLGPGQELWNSLVRTYASQFQFCYLGEQPSQKISEFLNTIDFGIGTTPFAIIGKSATAIAMVEHGVPVIVNRNELHFRGYQPSESISPLLIKMDSQLAGKLGSYRRGETKPFRPLVAQQFLESLNEA